MSFPTYTTPVPTEIEEITVILRKGRSAEGDSIEHSAGFRLVVLDQDGKPMTDFPWVKGDLLPHLEGSEPAELVAFINTLIARAETALGIT